MAKPKKAVKLTAAQRAQEDKKVELRALINAKAGDAKRAKEALKAASARAGAEEQELKFLQMQLKAMELGAPNFDLDLTGWSMHSEDPEDYQIVSWEYRSGSDGDEAVVGIRYDDLDSTWDMYVSGSGLCENVDMNTNDYESASEALDELLKDYEPFRNAVDGVYQAIIKLRGGTDDNRK